MPIATGQHLDPEDDPDDEIPHSFVETAPKLQPLDTAMRTSLGFGVDALAGVLNVATQWHATDEAPVTSADRESVVATCLDLTTGATADEYLAALNWVTLSSSDSQAETIAHWETDRRARRISACPFVEAGEGFVWVLPWTAESSIRVLANYLSDGRLPWPNSALPTAVVSALETFRQAQNRELEDQVAAGLTDHGFIVRKSVKREKRAHYGLAALSGEIDAICIDVERSRIWVIEAKDPTIPFSGRNIRRMVDDFHKPKGYVSKLERKTREVEASASTLAAALAVPEPERDWTVVPLVVTRRVDPAAFAVNPRLSFCVADDVVDIVGRDQLPCPGFHEQT